MLLYSLWIRAGILTARLRDGALGETRFVTQDTSTVHTVDLELTARRHCSTSPRFLALCFVCLAAIPGTIGLGLALFLGAWLVLPFAGIEIAALAAAFVWVARHIGDYEKVTVEGDRLIVEVQDAVGLRRHEMNVRWARLVVESRGGEARLALRSHGREIEIGRLLDRAGKLEWGRRLHNALRRTDKTRQVRKA